MPPLFLNQLEKTSGSVEIMIKIGETLILEPKFSLQPEKYKSKIQELSGDYFYVDYPVNLSTNRTVFMTDGTQLKCTYIGADQSVYIFDTEVLGRKKGELPLVQLRKPPEDLFVKIQRRQFVRVDASVDVAIHPMKFEFQPFLAVTDDISAGGAAVMVHKRINLIPSTHIQVWLSLPLKSGEIHYLQIKCKIIRVIEVDDSKFNRVSIQFEDLSQSDRQLVIRFVFERQLEMRNKGL